MMEIPRDLLAGLAAAHGHLTVAEVLAAVAADLDAQSAATTAARKKSHQSRSRELTSAALHVREYADAFGRFDPDAEPTPAAAPASDAPRCASFRRTDADDTALCDLERGHDGDHRTTALGRRTWPRVHTGSVCGDALTIRGSAAHWNCALPLGHDGEIHWSDGVAWPRGTNPRDADPMFDRPDVGYPGKPAPDGLVIVDDPIQGDAAGGTIDWDRVELTRHDDGSTDIGYPACGDNSDGDTCMLPPGHTGKHIGHTGARWDQATPAAVIPAQRMTSEIKEEVMAGVTSFAMNGGAAMPTEPGPDALQVTWSDNGSAAPGPMRLIASVDATPGGPDAVVVAQVAPSGGFTLVAAATPPAPPWPSTRPAGPRSRYSVSSIESMESCGLKFRLTYHDGAPKRPMWAGVAGSAFHAVVESIERAHANGSPDWSTAGDPLEQEQRASGMWRTAFAAKIAETERDNPAFSRGEWYVAAGGKEDHAWWLTNGEDMVRRYVNTRRWWLADGWTLLTKPDGTGAQELEFTAHIGVDGVPVYGFIDDVWWRWTPVEGVREVRIVDYKSGARKPSDPFQLKTYGEALRQMGALGPQDLLTGQYYMARKGERTPAIDLTEDDRPELAYRTDSTVAQDRAGIFPVKPSDMCVACPVIASCALKARR